jgi:hypothetical protein
MCVAQGTSYQEELLALIRKAQAKGLRVADIEYDATALIDEGRYIIQSVTIVGAHRIFEASAICAREYVREFLAKHPH